MKKLNNIVKFGDSSFEYRDLQEEVDFCGLSGGYGCYS